MYLIVMSGINFEHQSASTILYTNISIHQSASTEYFHLIYRSAFVKQVPCLSSFQMARSPSSRQLAMQISRNRILSLSVNRNFKLS